MSDAQEKAVVVSLVDQTDHFAVQALKSVSGAREDVAVFALIIAAYAAAQETARLHRAADPRAMVEAIVQNALRDAHEYARLLILKGTIVFSPSPRFHHRTDAELRALGVDLGGES